MNKVIIQGRICSDIRDIKNGKAFTVAVRRNYRNKVTGEYDSDFISCIAFGGSATLVANYFTKGDPIAVAGSWQTGSYQKDGVTIYTNTCVVNEVGFVAGATLKRNATKTAPTAVATGEPPVTVDPFSSCPF